MRENQCTIPRDDFDAIRACLDKLTTVMNYNAKCIIELDCGYQETSDQLDTAYRWLLAQETDQWSINKYIITRHYGGPEEGGWWYDRGEFVECLGTYDSRDYAEHALENEQERIKEEAEYCPDKLRLLIETKPGEDFPRERPHYE